MDQDLKKNHLENGNSIKGTTDDESKGEQQLSFLIYNNQII